MQIQAIHITGVIKARRSADRVEEVLVDHYARSILSSGQIAPYLQALHARGSACAGRAVNVAIVGAGFSKGKASASMRLKSEKKNG